MKFEIFFYFPIQTTIYYALDAHVIRSKSNLPAKPRGERARLTDWASDRWQRPIGTVRIDVNVKFRPHDWTDGEWERRDAATACRGGSTLAVPRWSRLGVCYRVRKTVRPQPLPLLCLISFTSTRRVNAVVKAKLPPESVTVFR